MMKISLSLEKKEKRKTLPIIPSFDHKHTGDKISPFVKISRRINKDRGSTLLHLFEIISS